MISSKFSSRSLNRTLLAVAISTIVPVGTLSAFDQFNPQGFKNSTNSTFDDSHHCENPNFDFLNNHRPNNPDNGANNQDSPNQNFEENKKTNSWYLRQKAKKKRLERLKKRLRKYHSTLKKNQGIGSYEEGLEHYYFGKPLPSDYFGPELHPGRKAALNVLDITKESATKEEIRRASRKRLKGIMHLKEINPARYQAEYDAIISARNYLVNEEYLNDDQVILLEGATPEPQVQEPETPEQPPVRPALSKGSPVARQASALYSAAPVQMLSVMNVTAMTHHGMATRSLQSGRSLHLISAQDLNTGEMLASNNNLASTSAQLSEGGLYSYGQIYGYKSDQGNLKSLPGFTADGYGLEVGVFKQLTTEWSAGILLGMQKMNSSIKESAGSMNASNFRLGPFVSWNKDQWHFDAALTYGITDLDGKRNDPQGGQYKASTKMKDWIAYTSLGYDIPMDHVATGLTLTPNVEVMYINSSIDGFKEKGQGKNALKVGSQSQSQWVTRTGVQLSYAMPHAELPQEFRAGIGYQKSSLKDSELKVGYADQSAMQQLKAPAYGNDAIYYNAGYSVMLQDNQSLSLDYFGSTGSKSQSHALALTYEMKF